MEKCICYASIMIENNKELKCKAKYCKCICEYNIRMCRSDRHKCACEKNSHECKSKKHICVCDKFNNECRLENLYSDYLQCYIYKHTCICSVSNNCLASKHDCLCKYTPFRCKRTENHICSCRINKNQCKAIKHEKICFIEKIYNYFKPKKNSSYRTYRRIE